MIKGDETKTWTIGDYRPVLMRYPKIISFKVIHLGPLALTKGSTFYKLELYLYPHRSYA